MLNKFAGLGKATDDTDNLEQEALDLGMADVRIRRFPSPPISRNARFMLIELDERDVWIPLGKSHKEALESLRSFSDALDAECTCERGRVCDYCELEEPNLSIDAMIEVELQITGELKVRNLKRKTVLDIEVRTH